MAAECQQQSSQEELCGLRERIAYLEARLAEVEQSRAPDRALAPPASAQPWMATEARFRKLAEHSPVGIWQCDLEGHLLFANDRFRLLTGSVECNDRTACWFDTVHPHDRESVQNQWRGAVAARAEFVSEFRFAHRDGTFRWVWGRAVPMEAHCGDETSYLGSVLDITERKVAENALRASEQRFRLLSNCSPVGIFVTDETGQITYCNPRLQTIYGYGAAELHGFGYIRVLPPEERDEALQRWLQAAPTQELYGTERRILAGDGQVRWIQMRSAPLVSPRGKVMGRVGTVEDITLRRLAHEQLRNSEDRYRVLAEHATDLISRHTPEGVYLYASPACRTLLGYEPEELVGRCVYELYHPEDLAAMRESHSSIGEPLRIGNTSYRICRQDGQYIWFETLAKCVTSAQGSEEILAISRDITVRRQAAEQLRASEARMRGLLDTAGDAIITIDESGTIETFNLGAERLFGYLAEEVVGRNVRLLMPPELSERYGSPRTQRLFTRGPVKRAREVLGRRKDGSDCELELRLGETIVGGRSIFTGILHDISERKRTEKMLRESEKLAATGRIAARIAHEINNPLAGIKNSFLLVRNAIAANHPYFSYVARIENEIDRIARIVRQMFDLYRPDHVTLRPVELDATIRDVVALLATSRETVHLSVDTSQAPRAAHLPEDSIRQVLYNVLVNAIEASPAGGAVRIQAEQQAAGVVISISDQGPGIPRELQSQIYEPFFTTKSLSGTGGLGLGLPISRGLVEAMQGRLEFETAPGQGTTFRICLPTSQEFL